MSTTDRPERSVRSIARALIGPLISMRTYARLLYLVIAFPLSMFYWLIFGFGLTIGTLLTIVLVGIAVLLVMVGVVRAVVAFERWLANALLDVSIEPTEDVEPGDGLAGTIRGYLDAPSTWRGFGFISLKFFLGLVGVILAYGLVQGFSLVSAVARLPHSVSFGEVNGEPVIWTIETLPQATGAMILGVAVVLVVVHLANGFGYVAARMATALLGE